MVCEQFFWNLLYTANRLILFTIFSFLGGQNTKVWSSLGMRIMLPFSNGYLSFFGFVQWIQGVTSATFWEQTGRCCVIKTFKKNFQPLKKKLDSLQRNWYLSLPLLVCSTGEIINQYSHYHQNVNSKTNKNYYSR